MATTRLGLIGPLAALDVVVGAAPVPLATHVRQLKVSVSQAKDVRVKSVVRVVTVTP